MRKYHDVTIAINDAAPYIPCLESHENLILTATRLKISQINLKIQGRRRRGAAGACAPALSKVGGHKWV